MIDIELHKRLEANATVAPWMGQSSREGLHILNKTAQMEVAKVIRWDDANFLVLLRNDHAAMIKEIEALRQGACHGSP